MPSGDAYVGQSRLGHRTNACGPAEPPNHLQPLMPIPGRQQVAGRWTALMRATGIKVGGTLFRWPRTSVTGCVLLRPRFLLDCVLDLSDHQIEGRNVAVEPGLGD